MGTKHRESTISTDTMQHKSTSRKQIEPRSGIWCIHCLGFDMIYFVVNLHKLLLTVIFNLWFQRSRMLAVTKGLHWFLLSWYKGLNTLTLNYVSVTKRGRAWQLIQL